MQINNMPLNTIKLNQYNQNKNKNFDLNFKGNVAQLAEDVAPKSKFFKPVRDFTQKQMSPLINAYDKVTDFIAKSLGKVLDTKTAVNIIEKTKKSKYLVANLNAAASVVVSGFYIKKTLGNDKLDPEKKKTLAINQAVVWGVATVLGYSMNGAVSKEIDKVVEKFDTLNKHNVDKINLGKYKNGIKVASQLMIFDMVYRYLAPVVVTPIANRIGQRLQEKKAAQAAQEKNLTHN